MSVLVLSLESFGNVRKTLGSIYLREEPHSVNVCRILGVGDMHHPAAIDKMFDAIDNFVRDCYKWNCLAYSMRYKEECEPTETEFEIIRKSGKIVSKAQVFQTLSCIDYNSDIRDYLYEDEYEKCEWHDEFEQWHKKLDDLCRAVAESVACEKADEEGCTWG